MYQVHLFIRVAWKTKCQGRDLSSYSEDCFNLKVKEVPNSVDFGSQEYVNTGDEHRPSTLKEIVLSQGGEELQSLWEKFFGS